MGSATTNRAKGKLDELAGKAKARIGKVIGNEQMQIEGKARALKGQAAQQLAKAGERAKGKVEEVTGAMKKGVGGMIDNEQMRAEGAAKQMKGSIRQSANK